MMRIHSKRKDAKTWAQAGYLPIQIASLRIDIITGFDIFLAINPDDAPVLYCERSLPITAAKMERLKETGQTQVYVSTQQEKEYRKYIESNLENILMDETVPPAERVEVLYDSAQYHLQELFAEPRSKDLLARSRSIVRSSCALLIKERQAFGFLLSIISHDYYTYTHSVNTFVYAFTLAQRAGYSDPQILYDFAEGAMLHDIGKSLLDPAIIRSKDKLTSDQWVQMRKHPQFGHEILIESGHLGPIGLDVVRHHHEKMNGTGYPDCLQGRAIHPLVRLFTIVDIFDALTTERPYKGALPSFAALKLMKDEMSDGLDPEFLHMFVKLMGNPGKA